jgi:hypothetical protein
MNIKSEIRVMMKEFEAGHSSNLFRDKINYANWLAQTYFFVRHSTALLGYALPYLQNDELRHHFENHLSEETRHDALALKDLKNLGYDISEFEEYSLTQGFYQSQYYRIAFEGGTSLLGYILWLESLAAGWAKKSYENIKDLHKGSVLFLKVHAEEDPQHVVEAINTIMNLSEKEQLNILKNMQFTHEIYSHIMEKALCNKVQLKIAV